VRVGCGMVVRVEVAKDDGVVGVGPPIRVSVAIPDLGSRIIGACFVRTEKGRWGVVEVGVAASGRLRDLSGG